MNDKDFTRRRFLAAPAALGSAALLSAQSPNDTVRVAFIAVGHSPDTYTEYRKLLERKDIDAVVIATPVDFHKEMAIAALEIGKNVYCEKPMAVTPEDCRQVTNTAASAKGIFQA